MVGAANYCDIRILVVSTICSLSKCRDRDRRSVSPDPRTSTFEALRLLPYNLSCNRLQYFHHMNKRYCRLSTSLFPDVCQNYCSDPPPNTPKCSATIRATSSGVFAPSTVSTRNPRSRASSLMCLARRIIVWMRFLAAASGSASPRRCCSSTLRDAFLS